VFWLVAVVAMLVAVATWLVAVVAWFVAVLLFADSDVVDMEETVGLVGAPFMPAAT